MFGRVEPIAEVAEPFVELIGGAVGEATDEAGPWLTGFVEVEHELGRVDDDALHGGVEDDLGGDRVESHLVRGRPLIEVVITKGGHGGFVVHDKEGAVEFFHGVEVAAEEIGLGAFGRDGVLKQGSLPWPPIKLEPKAQLHRGLAVGFDVGLGRVVAVGVEVPDNRADKHRSGLVLAGLGKRVGRVVGGADQQGLDHVEHRVVVGDPCGLGLVIVLEGLVVLGPEPKMNRLASVAPEVDVLVLVEPRAGFECAETGGVPCEADVGTGEERRLCRT